MRWFITVVVGLLALGTEKVSAHEHWLNADSFYPAIGKTGKVFICSGHAFPKSNMVLKDRVLHNARIIKPDGNAAIYKTMVAGSRRSGGHVFETNGVYLVAFELKQPQMKEPLYWAKSIIVAGGSDDEKLYSVGKGLEIVPRSKISALKVGDTLPLIVQYNGTKVKARLRIIPEQGKNASLSTTAQRAASLVVSHGGRHLVTAGYKGKSCSLTFEVQQSGGAK